MKKLAILIYPEFSIQEIGDLLYLFRWGFDIETDIIASTKDVVVSEEGISIVPDKTIHDFKKEAYHCLVLPGCSDFIDSITDEALMQFLKQFKDDTEFVIGAIGSGPIFLSYAGILDDKLFTNALFEQFNEQCHFIKHEHIVRQPVVVDGNIVTAIGNAHRTFAIAVARASGFECASEALMEPGDDYSDEDFIHRLSDEAFEEVKAHFKVLFEDDALTSVSSSSKPVQNKLSFK